jgi:hypothetical protein
MLSKKEFGRRHHDLFEYILLKRLKKNKENLRIADSLDEI